MNTKLATRQVRLNEWAAIIKDCRASDKKVDVYCEQHGLSRDAYYYWLRKVEEAASDFKTQMIIKINGTEFCVMKTYRPN